MAREATVISGLRGQNAIPQREEPGTVTAKRAATVGEVIYIARAANYWLQLIAQEDVYSPLTGHRERGRNVVAKFKGHVFRTKDPEVIALMESKKDYGLGRDFWRQDDEQKHVANVKVATLSDQLSGVDPEMLDDTTRAKLIKALGGVVKPEFVPAA
jgi:hypothetical protein